MVFATRSSCRTGIGGYGSRLRGDDSECRATASKSHRHLAVPHRRTRSEALRGIDDGVGIHAVVAVEVVDGAGLAEMLDAQSLEAVPAHAAKPAQRRGMAVDHSDDAAVARQRRQQFFDVAGVLRSAVITAD